MKVLNFHIVMNTNLIWDPDDDDATSKILDQFDLLIGVITRVSQEDNKTNQFRDM